MSQQLSTNTFTYAKWIVSSDATQGTHTTIAAALTSASSGDTIAIRDGTYTQDQTLKAGVNLCAYGGSGLTPNVTIVGNLTASFAGTCTISGIRLQTNSANLLTVSGSSATIVNLVDCYLNCTNNTGISYSSSSGSSKINVYTCSGDLGTTGIGFWSNSGAGSFLVRDSQFSNSGSSLTASTNSAGVVTLRNNSFASPISSSSTAVLQLTSINVDCSALNTTAVTHNGTGSNSVCEQCTVGSGTASAVSIGTGATLQMTGGQYRSSNTNCITGAGTVEYSCLSFTGSSSTINTTTQTQSGTIQGSTTTAPSAGFIGERISALATSVNLPNNTPTNVGSISLTAGNWDISLIGQCNFSGASTLFQVGISSVSATLPSGSPDAGATFGITSGASSVSTLTVPAYRVTPTTTTTYYAVEQANFSTGAASGFSRISAVRVA